MLTEEQLARRRRGVGASDIAAVVGLVPYRSAYDVYREKRGELAEAPSSPAIERGNWLEGPIADWYAERTGRAVEPSETLEHPREPWILATPDRLVVEGGRVARVVEIKARGEQARRHYGRPGTDECAPWDVCQVQWQMLTVSAALGYLVPVADLVVAFGTGMPEIYTVGADARLQVALVEAGRRFWIDHVLAGVAPAWTPEERLDAARPRSAAAASGPLDASPPEADALFERRRAAVAALRHARAELAEVDARLAELAAGRAGFADPAGRVVRWRARAPRRTTRWRDVAIAAGASPALVAAHTTTPDPELELEVVDDVGDESPRVN